eukprot:gb/GECG01006386.1/.p1 GENE.gb/GECG01006386.1/~~gb/GECG01006386.1/.p1  ORF type:complete len:407 (+),score=52.48 gb/GECG01006386.1/:1-1221(+)
MLLDRVFATPTTNTRACSGLIGPWRTTRRNTLQLKHPSLTWWWAWTSFRIMGKSRNKGPKFYAVVRGRSPGIYRTWDEAKEQVHQFPGAKHRSFISYEEANRWFAETSSSSPSVASLQAPRSSSSINTGTGGPQSYHIVDNKHRPLVPLGETETAASSKAKSTSGSGPSVRPLLQEQEEDEPIAAATISSSASTATSGEPTLSGKKRGREQENASGCGSDYTRKSNRQGTARPNNEKEFELILEADGGARGNPGIGGAGAACYVLDPDTEEKKLLRSYQYFVGDMVTNNEAEYRGFILALELFWKSLEAINTTYEGDFASIRFSVVIELDSNLVVNQIMGKWKVSAESLKPLHTEALKGFEEVAEFPQVSQLRLRHIFRDFNKQADSLANQAMDTKETELKEWSAR